MFSFDDGCRKLRDNPTTTVMLNIMNSALQQCPPWTLRAWPTLLWQVGKQVPLRLHHIGTQITNPGDAVFRTAGQTLWACYGGHGDVGMAWDWVQLTRGVVAMADPMAVVTNLRLVGDEGQELDALESARHINFIVHGLPWQDEVERALGAPAGAQAAGASGRSPLPSIGAPGSLLAQ